MDEAERMDQGAGITAAERPLAGRRVLVTRPEGQADELVRCLEALGAEPVLCSTVRIVPPADFGPMDAAIARLTDYDWVIFTSVNGVRFFFGRLAAAGTGAGALASLHLGAIGPATAEALERQGLRAAFVPQEYVAEAILGEIGDVAGARILLPRADIARKALAEGLRAKGARVDEVVAYQTVAIEDGDQPVPAQKIDVATFTSPSTVRNFVAMLRGQAPAEVLQDAIVACIGPITAAAAQAEGLRVDVVAPEHTVPGLLDALIRYVKESRR
jgi:uroporphyrinogen-III synthase